MDPPVRQDRRLGRGRVVIAVLVAALVFTGSTLIFELTRPPPPTAPSQDWTCYSVSSAAECTVGLLPSGVTLPLAQGGLLTVNFTTPSSAQGQLNLSVDFPGQYQNISFAIFRMSEYQTIISSPMSHLSDFNRSLGAVFFANSTPWIAGGSSKWVFILFNPSSDSESVSFPSGAYLTFRS